MIGNDAPSLLEMDRSGCAHQRARPAGNHLGLSGRRKEDHMKRSFLVCGLLASLCACSKPETPPPGAPVARPSSAPVTITTMPRFEAAPVLERIKALSADEFEGRAPGSKGEDLTVKYLEDAFRTLGVKPGNTWHLHQKFDVGSPAQHRAGAVTKGATTASMGREGGGVDKHVATRRHPASRRSRRSGVPITINWDDSRAST